MQKTIEVTEEDIRNGFPKSFKACPIARAMRRAFGTQVDVTEYHYYVMGYEAFHHLPLRAQNAIYRYDKTGEMKPFSFSVYVED